MGSRWGPEGPPHEAYSRVTNPERFAPLHELAVETLTQLESKFDVMRMEGVDIDAGVEWVRPTVQLTPQTAEAGELAIGFTNFPGLIIRLGHWMVEPIPLCGCDACDETAEEGGARLGQLVSTLGQGRFHERIRVPVPGRRLVRVCDAERRQHEQDAQRTGAGMDRSRGRPDQVQLRPVAPESHGR
jgi:hypothetical protein